jgi:hypothetical protein
MPLGYHLRIFHMLMSMIYMEARQSVTENKAKSHFEMRAWWWSSDVRWAALHVGGGPTSYLYRTVGSRCRKPRNNKSNTLTALLEKVKARVTRMFEFRTGAISENGNIAGINIASKTLSWTCGGGPRMAAYVLNLAADLLSTGRDAAYRPCRRLHEASPFARQAKVKPRYKAKPPCSILEAV